jgi:hypothetical protein
MSKWFTDNGFLSKDAQFIDHKTKLTLDYIFLSPEVEEMSIDEIRTLGAVLSKIVGDFTSTAILKKQQENK